MSIDDATGRPVDRAVARCRILTCGPLGNTISVQKSGRNLEKFRGA